MNCIVIGAGNAGRPAARILNYGGHQVQITDQKNLEEFPEKVRETLLKMEKEGIKLNLGLDTSKKAETIYSSFKNLDSAYISPTIPNNSAVREILNKKGLKLIRHIDISKIVDETIKIDVIGITGTLGKTSTTHIISHIFRSAGYKVWACSSRDGNLLSEVIVEGIMNGEHLKNDVAVLELPHGTSRLMSKVNLKIGVLTNIYPEHLSEFDNSLEKYIERKLFITGSSEILISSPQCKEILEPVRNDVIFYCIEKDSFKGIKNSSCNVSGCLEENQVRISYHLDHQNSAFKNEFKLKGYYFENSLAAATVALCYGLNETSIKKGLSSFNGVAGHMEYIGNYCGREVHFDAAFVPEGLFSTLKQFSGHNLVILIDNPDSTTPRDKYKIGSILGKYAKVIISSGYNETTGILSNEAANEVLNGVKNLNVVKIAVEDMKTAGKLSIKHSYPGDTILHVGPGAITNYDELKLKMMSGIKEGCKIQNKEKMQNPE
jgi:UDP-N-acetylmuramoylalanine--D-glutamate ligase